MGEMVSRAASVTGIEGATPLEARVRELRLIAAHKPRYNKRSRFPDKVTWLKLTVEPWPRLSMVRKVADDGADYLGPFSSRRTAEKCLAALHEAFPIRQCSDRLPLVPSRTPCVLAEMGRCLSPCDGSVDVDRYAALVADVRANLLQGADVVAARREDDHRWAVHVVRSGRLAASGVIPVEAHAGVWVTQLRASAESVVGGPGPTPAATAEESEQILRWLEQPGVRLVHVEGEWTCPVRGAARHLAIHDGVEQSRTMLVPFDERRGLS